MTLELFDPEANGSFLLDEYDLNPREQVTEMRTEIGSVETVADSTRIAHRLALPFFVRGRDALEYIQGFWNGHVGAAGRFQFKMPEFVPSPYKAPDVDSVTGGTQGARTITVRFNWVNDAGETRASPTASLAVPSGELIRAAMPVYPPTVTQVKVYAAEDDPGNEVYQLTLFGEREWVQPDAALLTATASPPSANTATQIVTAKFIPGTLVLRRLKGPNYRVDLQLEEVYS